MKSLNLKYSGLFLMAAAIGACTPDSNINGTVGPKPKASFTQSVISATPNRIAVAATTQNAFNWQWSYAFDKFNIMEKDTLEIARKGDYRILLSVVSDGGVDTTSQIVTIAQDAPRTDLLKGGDFAAGSESNWTVLDVGGDQTTFKIAGGVLNLSNGTKDTSTNGAIYQAITVKPNTDYVLEANVSGPATKSSWVEFYLGTATPTTGADYTTGKFLALGADCMNTTFNGDIADIACVGSTGSKGVIHFTTKTLANATNNVIYLVIKAGSGTGNLGAGGVNVDNVKLSEVHYQ